MPEIFSFADGHHAVRALEHAIPELGSLYALFPNLAPLSINIAHEADGWLPARNIELTTRGAK